MPSRSRFRLCGSTVLLAALSLLTACGTGVYLGSRKPATIEVPEYERVHVLRYPASRPAGSGVLTLLPFGVGSLADIAVTALSDSEKNVVSRIKYTEAIRIHRIDGEAVALTATEVEVPFGEHTIEVKYCRYEALRSACSPSVELSFRAEAGEGYRLRRNSKLQIEMVPRNTNRKTVRSETRSVVPQDEEDCVRKRKHAIENRWRGKSIDRAEALRLKARVDAECRRLVRG